MIAAVRFSRFRKGLFASVLPALLLFLVGCEGRIESFSFIDRRPAEPVAAELRDPARLSPEEEPVVSEVALRVVLDRPVLVEEGAGGIYFRFRGSGSQARLRLGYERGSGGESEGELRWQEHPLPATRGFDLPVSYYGSLFEGRLKEIEIHPGPAPLRVVELGIAPYPEGVEMSRAGLRISAGYDIATRDGVLYLLLPGDRDSGVGEILELELEQPWEGIESSEERPLITVATMPSAPALFGGSTGDTGNLPREATISDGAKATDVVTTSEGAVSDRDGVASRYSYRPLPGLQRVHLHTALDADPIEAVALTGGNETAFKAVRRRTVEPGEPIPADLRTLLDYPRELWRRESYELFSWSAYPEILFIDTEDYALQSRLFKRLAFFVEKEGFRGRLLTDGELRGRHGWNAHNYRPRGLADFFNAAAAEQFPLNEEERLLRQIALEQGLILRSDGGATEGSDPYAPGRGGILSVSRESWGLLRELLVIHEAMHGIYYQEPQFRERVAALWDEEMSADERDFWRFFLSYMSYDPEDSYLMQNEMQAYLLQYPLENIPGYFQVRIADRLRAGVPYRSSYVDGFMREHGGSFGRHASALNDFLFRETGFRGAEVFLLEAGE